MSIQLNMITLGQSQIDHINHMLTVANFIDLHLVFPTSSIEYPGTRVIYYKFNYLKTRVIGSSINILF